MEWWGQYFGQLRRVAMVKFRTPYTLAVELLVPFILLLVLGNLKTNKEPAFSELRSYVREALNIPSLETLNNLPTAEDFIANQSTGMYYFLHAEKIFRRGGNIAFACDPNGIAGTFSSLCEELKYVIIPENQGYKSQESMSESLKLYLGALANGKLRSRILIHEDIVDNDSLNEYMQASTYGDEAHPKIGAAVVFRSPLSYVLRVNQTKRNNYEDPWTESEPVREESSKHGVGFGLNIPGTISPSISNRKGREPFSDDYLFSGLLSLQKTVDEFLLSQSLEKNVSISINQFPHPTPAFGEDLFWMESSNLYGFFLVAGFLFPLVSTTYAYVSEKECEFRELMFMMGLEPSAHMLAWLSLAMLLFTLEAGWLVGISAAGGLFGESESIIIFLVFTGYLYASLSHAFLLGSFFSSAESAALVGILLTIFFFLMTSLGSSMLWFQLILSFIHPVVGLGYTIDIFGSFQSDGVGISFENWGIVNGTASTRLSIEHNTYAHFIQFVIYILCAGYVDSVTSSVHRAPRAPWHWPLTMCFRSKLNEDYQCRVLKQEELEEALETSNSTPFQPVAEDLKEIRRSGRGIMITNIEKTYKPMFRKPVHALKGVTLSAFEGQITALLGSNGAGKTTLSGILCGMVSSYSGKVSMNGFSAETDMKAIRKRLGVCPQHNVFTPLLTVKEHLELFCSIKGVPKEKVPELVEKVSQEVGLEGRWMKVEAAFLSGGYKRRLQLAIALLQSDICILDEPTSGLDVASRRQVQSTISKYRQKSTIIITTHYMDEADLLGDRILIMDKGQLACCGTSLFLKKRYGVGYLLTFTQASTAAPSLRATLLKRVRDFVPDCGIVLNTKTELVVRLPLGASNVFAPLLRQIERESEKLDLIGSPGIAVTNLDSVFLEVMDRSEMAPSEEEKRTSLLDPKANQEVGAFVVPVEHEKKIGSFQDQDHEPHRASFAKQFKFFVGVDRVLGF